MRPADLFFTDNIPPEAIESYKAYFHGVDIRMRRAVPGAIDSIVTDRDLVQDDVVDRHEFYQDFLRPIGHRYVVTAIMGLDKDLYAFCSSHRGLHQDHADPDVVDRAALIMPHLRRSLQLRRRLVEVDMKGRAVCEVLDSLEQAVFLIDGERQVVWQNAWAGRLLDQRDGLITVDGELRSQSPLANGELQRLLKAAVGRRDRLASQPGGMMLVHRPSLKRPYQLLVTPLPTPGTAGAMPFGSSANPVAAIFIMDLEQNPAPKAEVLSALYHLTPAEARLAMALAKGTSVKAYAERTELSIHYVRWLLKQVEAKTETRRLTDLIRLLARHNGFFSKVIDDEKAKN